MAHGAPSRNRKSNVDFRECADALRAKAWPRAAPPVDYSLELLRQHEPVPDGGDGQADAEVPGEAAVEGAHGFRIRVPVLRVGDAPAPEHVIGDNQAARPDQRKGAVVIGLIILLVRVDKRQVESPGLPFRQELVQGFQRRSQAQLDPLLHAGLPPGSPCAVRIFRAAVASHQSSAGRQRESHPRGAVPHEHAYLQRPTGADGAGQQMQKLPLLRRNLAGRVRMVLRALAQAPQRLRLAHGYASDVFGRFSRYWGVGPGHLRAAPIILPDAPCLGKTRGLACSGRASPAKYVDPLSKALPLSSGVIIESELGSQRHAEH